MNADVAWVSREIHGRRKVGTNPCAVNPRPGEDRAPPTDLAAPRRFACANLRTDMRPVALPLLASLALAGCSDLSKPGGFRVSRDATGSESQVEVAPNNLVRVKGPDGKVVEVPRLHPPGTPSAGQPVLPGQKVVRSPRVAGSASAAPTAAPAVAAPSAASAPKP